MYFTPSESHLYVCFKFLVAAPQFNMVFYFCAGNDDVIKRTFLTVGGVPFPLTKPKIINGYSWQFVLNPAPSGVQSYQIPSVSKRPNWITGLFPANNLILIRVFGRAVCVKTVLRESHVPTPKHGDVSKGQISTLEG